MALWAFKAIMALAISQLRAAIALADRWADSTLEGDGSCRHVGACHGGCLHPAMLWLSDRLWLWHALTSTIGHLGASRLLRAAVRPVAARRDKERSALPSCATTLVQHDGRKAVQAASSRTRTSARRHRPPEGSSRIQPG